MMKRILSGFIIFISSAIVLLISLIISYDIYLHIADLPQEVVFVVDEEISLVIGEEYALSPYIINEDNEIEYGQYTYQSNCNEIQVSDAGVIVVKSQPKTDDVYITITDLNRGITKKIKLNISVGIINIFDITGPEGTEMRYGLTYEYEVTLLPADVDLSTGYVSFSTADHKEVNVDEIFDISYNGNKVQFKAIGLGQGTLKLNVKSEKDLVDYSEEFLFDIRLENSILTDDITQGNLVNKTELANLNEINFTGSELDINHLKVFENLEHIVFKNEEEVCSCYNLSNDYLYYVKENLFVDYYNNDAWNNVFDSVKPYSEDKDDKYVIYYSEKDEELSCQKVDLNFEFKNLNFAGYNHDSRWSFSKDGSDAVSKGEIINSQETRIVLYAVWNPITYYIEFHSTIGSGDSVLYSKEDNNSSYIKCEFDQEVNLKQINSFHHTSKEGYVFLGWRLNVNETTFADTPEKINEIDYRFDGRDLINVINLTETDGETVKLYDAWRPIEYKIVFDRDDEAQYEMRNIPTEITLQYDKTYTLNDLFFDIAGYEITSWSYNKNKFTPIQPNITNLAFEDNKIIVLTPTLNEKKYIVEVQLPNGNNLSQSNADQYLKYRATVKYTDILSNTDIIWKNSNDEIIYYDLNFNVQKGNVYESHYWFIDSNSNTTYDLNEPKYDPDHDLYNPNNNNFSLKDLNASLVSDTIDNIYNGSMLIVRPKGVSATYTLTINGCKDVSITNEKIEIETANYILSNAFDKVGQDHIGWMIYKNDSNNPITIISKEVVINKSTITDHSSEWTLSSGDVIVIEPYYKYKETNVNYMVGNVLIKAGEVDFINNQHSKIVYNSSYSLPVNVDYIEGWYKDEGLTIKLSSTGTWQENVHDITLYAKIKYDVLYDMCEYDYITADNDGNSSGYIKDNKVIYGGSFTVNSNPSKTGFTFNGWYFNGEKIDTATCNKHGNISINNKKLVCTVTLQAKWTATKYKIEKEDGNQGGSYSVSTIERANSGYTTGFTNSEFMIGDKVTVSISYNASRDQDYSISNAAWKSGKTFTFGASNVKIKITSKTACVAYGTLVTMGDGTYKKVEDLSTGDIVLAWDFEKGKFVQTPILLNVNLGVSVNLVINLKFEDGTLLKLIDEHSIFDYTTNSWAYINVMNYQSFLEHEFIKEENGIHKQVKLIDAFITEEECGSVTILTKHTINCYSDSILSTSPATEGQYGFFHYFDLDQNMIYDYEKMNSDIELYGLYTYQEWEDYITYEVYDALNFKYLKVAVGKGLIKVEDIMKYIMLINYYS